VFWPKEPRGGGNGFHMFWIARRPECSEPSRKPILATPLQHELQAAGVISAKDSRLFERCRGKKKNVFALFILPVERLGAKARTFSESLLNC